MESTKIMADHFQAMLARGEWLGAMRDLAFACSDGDPVDAGTCVREMNALLVMAPDVALIEGLLPLRSSRLKELLEAGAHETAVMIMLSSGAGFLVSRGGDGQSLATVALPGMVHDESGTGATPALALLAALALSLSSAATSARVPTLRTPTGTRVALH